MNEALLIGLDAASNRRNFGYAIGRWSNNYITIEKTGCLAERSAKSDDAIQEIAERITGVAHNTRVLIAVDAPLGWPQPLAESLALHKAGDLLNSSKDALFNRTTDLLLKTRGHRPLEIGAALIARATVEALVVLEELRSRTRLNIPLAWTRDFEGQAVIEVYPAATLKAHGLPHTKYKNSKHPDALRELVQDLATELKNLQQSIDGNHNAFDAAVCVLSAGDFLRGHCSPPTEQARALKEGWTWVKDDHVIV